MEEIVSLNNVVKTFYSHNEGLFSLRRKKIEVFKGIDLSIRKGEMIAVLGPNGCGKTTLFKMISTLVLPNKGKIRIAGIDPVSNPIPVRALVSFVTSEERSFYFRLTGRQNLRFFATLCNIKKSEALKRIDHLVSLLKLEDHMAIKYQEFSTGLKQKLNLARGLLRDFAILLLDEPMKSVDMESSNIAMRYIKETLIRDQGKTVIMTTHNLNEAKDLADHYIVICKGKVVGDITKKDLGSRKLDDYYKDCLKDCQ